MNVFSNGDCKKKASPNDRCLICYKLVKTWKGNKVCNYYDLNTIVKLDNNNNNNNNKWLHVLKLIDLELCAFKTNAKVCVQNTLNTITIRDLINLTLNTDKPKLSDLYTKICEQCFKTLLFIQYFTQSISEFREQICKKYVNSLRIATKLNTFRKNQSKRKINVNGIQHTLLVEKHTRTLNGILSHSSTITASPLMPTIATPPRAVSNTSPTSTSQTVSQNRRKRKSIRPHHLKESYEDHSYDDLNENLEIDLTNVEAQTKRKRYQSESTSGPLNLSSSRDEPDENSYDCLRTANENSQHSNVSSSLSTSIHSQTPQDFSRNNLLRKTTSCTTITTTTTAKKQQPSSVSPTTSSSLHLDDTTSLHNASCNATLTKDSFKYTCDICDKSFKTQNILRQHLRIHTGDKPFQCTICSKCFSQMASLKYHLATHSDDRPYKCDTCTKSFKLKPPYKKHVRECRSKGLNDTLGDGAIDGFTNGDACDNESTEDYND